MLDRRFASWTGRFAPGAAESRVAWKQNGQAYAAVFHQQPSGDPMGVEHVVVDVTTTQGGKKLSTQMTMTRLSFSNFAQFVDRWDPEVRIHDDEIDGRFHSNSEIRPALDRQRVTRVSRQGHARGPRHRYRRLDVALESPPGLPRRRRDGRSPDRAAVALPRLLERRGDRRRERAAVRARGADHLLRRRHLRVELSARRRGRGAPHAHGARALPARARRRDATDQRPRPRQGARLHAGADRDRERLTLRARARDAPDADDYVGLVAEKTVEIAEPEVTGLGDLHVDASIYALRQFAVREFRSRPSGTLTIFGSLTAGSLTATEPRYATKIEFDPRLTNARSAELPTHGPLRARVVGRRVASRRGARAGERGCAGREQPEIDPASDARRGGRPGSGAQCVIE